MEAAVLSDMIGAGTLGDILRPAAAELLQGATARLTVLADASGIGLARISCEAAPIAAIKADSRCCVLWAPEAPQHETGKLALRAWLGARGLRSAEIDAACGPMAAPKSGQELVDGVKAFLGSQSD